VPVCGSLDKWRTKMRVPLFTFSLHDTNGTVPTNVMLGAVASWFGSTFKLPPTFRNLLRET
jgi:hypothetical protein